MAGASLFETLGEIGVVVFCCRLADRSRRCCLRKFSRPPRRLTIRVGYPQPSGAMLPLWVITEARLDQKYGFTSRTFIFPAAPG